MKSSPRQSGSQSSKLDKWKPTPQTLACDEPRDLLHSNVANAGANASLNETCEHLHDVSSLEL